MLFNSISFLIFFPLTVIGFFLLPHKYRWIFLLIASCFFYMYWKAEYIILLIISTVIDYFVSLKIEVTEAPAHRKRLLCVSIFANLGLLFVFKYYNFASSSLNYLAETLGYQSVCPIINVLLPVGISFYTFQTLSYTLDVYMKKRPAERHFGVFALYVSFFPQLVAGPIERSTTLMPQFHEKKYFDYDRFLSGARLMLMGFIKKLVLADNFALYADKIYGDVSGYGGLPLLIATYCFALQIYYDFSGYTDIARGASRILGFELMENFNFPYFAKSISDFWQRWHISLSTWFRDYLYIPLGGSRVPFDKWIRNILLVFILSGLWHGANWTFLIWGGLHGFFYIIEKLIGKIKTNLKLSSKYSAFPILSRLIVLNAVCFTWIFFRSSSLSDALIVTQRIFTFSSWQQDELFYVLPMSEVVFFFLLSLLMELSGLFQKKFMLHNASWIFKGIQWGSVYFWLFAMLIFANFTSEKFVYFQF